MDTIVVTENRARAGGRAIRLGIGEDGGLRLASDDGEGRAVRLVRCFPWSDPGRCFSLRDESGAELAFIGDPSALDPASREALDRARAEASFLFDILGVEQVEEEFQLRSWRVRTRQGIRTFQTSLEEWPRPIPGGGLLIRDVAGDLYRTPPPAKLDEASRRILWPYLD